MGQDRVQPIPHRTTADSVLPDRGVAAGARRIALAEAIAERWRRARIPYGVVHGLFGYPEGIGRDLDVAIEREHIWSAAGLALETAKEHGFGLPLFRWSHWGLYQIALIDPESGESLPIDLLCTTDVWRAKWVRVADERLVDRLALPDRHDGPFAISVEGHFLKACVRPLLCGDLRHFGGEFPLPVAVPVAVDKDRLVDLLGDHGMRLLRVDSLDQLEAAFPAAMNKMQFDWIGRHPLGALRSLLDSLSGRLKRRLFNAADVIFVETDNAEAVRRCLDDLAPEMKRMFIDLRPAEVDGGVVANLWGAIHGWRHPPVSEFVVQTVICGGIGRRRAPGADAVISVRGDGDPAALRNRLRGHILGVMATKHAPPPSLCRSDA